MDERIKDAKENLGDIEWDPWDPAPLGCRPLGSVACTVGQCDGHGIFLYFVSAYVYTQDRIPHMHIHICKYRQYVNVNTPQTFIDYI